MKTNTAVTHVLPEQSRVVTQGWPGQTRVVPPSRTTHRDAEKYVGGIADVVFRLFSLVFCLAVLIAASVTLGAVNTITTSLGVYENASSYRAVAGWLLFVGIAGIIFDCLMILIRILYMTSTIQSNFSGYAFANAILCALLALALLSGGIPSAIYAADNNDDFDTFCGSFSNSDFCDDLQLVYASQAATAAFTFMSVLTLVPLFIIMISSGYQKWQEEAAHSTSVTAADSATPYVPLPSSNY